jgi:hypothetical protein
MANVKVRFTNNGDDGGLIQRQLLSRASVKRYFTELFRPIRSLAGEESDKCGVTARIVPNHSAFGKRESSGEMVDKRQLDEVLFHEDHVHRPDIQYGGSQSLRDMHVYGAASYQVRGRTSSPRLHSLLQNASATRQNIEPHGEANSRATTRRSLQCQPPRFAAILHVKASLA